MRVLLGIDGSEWSKQGIEQVRSMVWRPNLLIKVVSVVDFEEPLPSLEGVKQRGIADAHTLVQDTVNSLKEKFAHVEGSVLDGLVVEKILSEAQDWQADLIVVGSHGISGFEEFFLGSVSRGVLSGAHCAVRMVRSPNQAANNLLLALDDSEHSRHAIEHVLSSSWSSDTMFKCITILPEIHEHLFPGNKLSHDQALSRRQELQINAETFLKECVQQLDTNFGSDKASFAISYGDPRKKILEAAVQWPAGLIVLGSHGRRFMSRFILGSVSETIASHAPCSVEEKSTPGTTPQTCDSCRGPAMESSALVDLSTGCVHSKYFARDGRAVDNSIPKAIKL